MAHLGEVLGIGGSDYERYEITAEVGERGEARVFKALDTKLDQAVAIKVMPRVGETFHKDVRAFSRCASLPRVVDCSGPGARVPFVVVEQVPGVDLGVLLTARPLPEKVAAAIGVGVARALAALHQHGVVHGELQPRSVFLEHGGRVLLLDAGVTKGVDAECMRPDAEPSGVMLAFKAKELSGAEADLFSLGAMLYFALSKKLPFDLSPEPPDLRDAGVSEPMWEVVLQLLRKPMDAERVATALKAVAADPSFGSQEEAIDAHVRGGATALPVTAIATAMLGKNKKKGKATAPPPDVDSTARLRLRTMFVRRRRRLMALILTSIALTAIAASAWIRMNAARFKKPVVAVKLEVPMAKLRVAVKPWGRVSIDGVDRGRTPTFTAIDLPLGEHVVVVTHPKLGKREVKVQLPEADGEQSVILDLFEK